MLVSQKKNFLFYSNCSFRAVSHKFETPISEKNVKIEGNFFFTIMPANGKHSFSNQMFLNSYSASGKTKVDWN